MKPSPSSHMATDKMDYKQLRRIDPEAARQAVIELLKTNDRNISKAALAFGINRSVVYDIIRKAEEGGLEDRPRVPKHQPAKTPQEIEDRVIQVRSKTRLGAEQLSRYLEERKGVSIPTGTIRHIIRRNKERIDYHPFSKSGKEKLRSGHA